MAKHVSTAATLETRIGEYALTEIRGRLSYKGFLCTALLMIEVDRLSVFHYEHHMFQPAHVG